MFPRVWPHADWKWQELRKKSTLFYDRVTKEYLPQLMDQLEEEQDFHIQHQTSNCIRCHTTLASCGCEFSERYANWVRQKTQEYQQFMENTLHKPKE